MVGLLEESGHDHACLCIHGEETRRFFRLDDLFLPEHETGRPELENPVQLREGQRDGLSGDFSPVREKRNGQQAREKQCEDCYLHAMSPK